MAAQSLSSLHFSDNNLNGKLDSTLTKLFDMHLEGTAHGSIDTRGVAVMSNIAAKRNNSAFSRLLLTYSPHI